MADTNVEINTVHDPVRGMTGEVYVNGKLILIIHSHGIDDRTTRNTHFTETEIKAMDKKIREWVNANLRAK